VNTEIHSVLFNNTVWNSSEARKWLKEHNMVPIKRVHVTKNYLRYRIQDPEKFKSFVTKTTDQGITFVFGIS